MNDRFKFRFYDKKNNFMITDEDSDENWDKCIELYDKDEWYFCIEKNLTFVLDYFDDKDFVVMQCTGLKDKNGKLIYEGDIVKINGWWYACGPAGYDNNLCVVEFDASVCGFTPMCNYDCDCGIYHDADDCEVIGNIYENKELLEEYKDE